jgi:hypothetical protein
MGAGGGCIDPRRHFEAPTGPLSIKTMLGQDNVGRPLYIPADERGLGHSWKMERTEVSASTRSSRSSAARFFQVGGIEALREPAVNWGEEIACFGPPPLFAPQPGEARRGAQFQRLRLLGLRGADRLLQGGQALVELVFGEQHSPGKAMEFPIPHMPIAYESSA